MSDITEEAFHDSWYDNSGDNSDADAEWPVHNEHQTRWEESDMSGYEAEGQQMDDSGNLQAVEGDLSDEIDCQFCLSHLTPLLETSSPQSSPTFSECEPTFEAEYSGTDQEGPSKKPSPAIEQLAMVLNDKKLLEVYLAGIDERIKEARRTKARKNADRKATGQYYAGSTQRSKRARGQNGKREWEQSQELVEEKRLRWFEYEKMHVYDESSGKWELTVERRGWSYRLARASDTEPLDQTRGNTKKPVVGNEDWATYTVPNWAVATGPGWFG